MPASVRSFSALSSATSRLTCSLTGARPTSSSSSAIGSPISTSGTARSGTSSPPSVAESRTPSGVTVVPAVARGRWLRRSSSSLVAIGLTTDRRSPEDAGQVVEVAGAARARRGPGERRQPGHQLGDLGGHRQPQPDRVDLAVHHAAGQPAAVVGHPVRAVEARLEPLERRVDRAEPLAADRRGQRRRQLVDVVVQRHRGDHLVGGLGPADRVAEHLVRGVEAADRPHQLGGPAAPLGEGLGVLLGADLLAPGLGDDVPRPLPRAACAARGRRGPCAASR